MKWKRQPPYRVGINLEKHFSPDVLRVADEVAKAREAGITGSLRSYHETDEGIIILEFWDDGDKGQAA